MVAMQGRAGCGTLLWQATKEPQHYSVQALSVGSVQEARIDHSDYMYECLENS